MASTKPVVVEYSVFGELLPVLSPAAQDVYECLLNNGIYAFQPNCHMDIDVVKAALGCYYGLVRAVFIQSPQPAYVDICPANELTSPGFCQFLFTGIHEAFFPDTLEHDCYVVFHPLQEQATSEQLVPIPIAVAENRELPGMNLQYLHRNPEWKPYSRPKILDLPHGDDLDDIEQQL